MSDRIALACLVVGTVVSVVAQRDALARAAAQLSERLQRRRECDLRARLAREGYERAAAEEVMRSIRYIQATG